MYLNNRRFSSLTLRLGALVLFAGASGATLSAQSPAAETAAKPLDLKASLMKPLDLSRPADLNYSSSAGADETAAATTFDLRGSETQPPPRRHYGRTNYSDRWHNPDGSKKYVFEAGGGWTNPVGATAKDLTVNWKFQGGAGYFFDSDVTP